MFSGTIQNPHLPGDTFQFERDGGLAILLLHGLLATPVEMRLIGQHLCDRGVSVLGPLLPGHGTTISDLNRTSYRDWFDCALEHYRNLRSRYRKVFVGGESMGGMLALLLGSICPEIEGIILFAPAVRPANKLAYLTPYIRWFIGSLTKNRSGDDNDSLVNSRWQGYTVDSPSAVAELLALQRRVKSRLSLIRQPLLIIQGKLDETLDIRGAFEVYHAVGSKAKELYWLERSTHCLAIDQEWDRAAELTLKFINGISCPTTPGQTKFLSVFKKPLSARL